MILVDTSAWVEFDRATGSAVDRRLTALIATTNRVAVTEPVVMEVLAGARDTAREQQLRRMMARFPLLRFRPTAHFDGAVTIYRSCRARGVTPRGLLDCMIAAVAQSEDVPVLAQDRDLARIATIMALQMDAASLTVEDDGS
ncbi:PIN domain nuclease [Euzebya tangerina]|uniref:type II toxin-antitoxin system VapC family toxin n=1 Tax=Euzebya tangerina TaxID=591198 RepID=UPI000E31EF9A|nr:PIN domain nuclease [Euzebya tangerina]